MKDERHTVLHSVLRVSCPSRSRFLVEFTLSKIPRFFLFAPLRVRMTSEEPALSEAKGLGMTSPKARLSATCKARLSAAYATLQKSKRYPRIILAIRWSVERVIPTPTPKLNSHLGER